MSAAPRRDEALVALRPPVDLGPDAPDPSALDAPARLLHGTLRPVLKLQNDTLLALVARAVAARTEAFARFDAADQRAHLDALVRRDVRLQRLLLGVVLGALTASELAAFLGDEAEMRRRVVALVAERVTSQAARVAEMAAA